MKNILMILSVCGAAFCAVPALARDYSGMVTPTKAEDAMWTKAADWSNNEAPTAKYDYYANGMAVYSCAYDSGATNPNTGLASRRDHFFGNVLYMNTTFYLINQTNPALAYPTTIENDGLVLLDGGAITQWGDNAYLDGKLTLENSSEDKYVRYFASTSNGTKNKYLAYLGALSGAATSGLFIGYNAAQTGGTVTFDFRGTATDFFGSIAGASGAVVRASASLPNGKVKLGHIPTGNAAAYNVLADNALGQNGRLEVAPLAGNALSLGAVSSAGGTIVVNPGTILSVGDLELTGGSLVLAGTGSDPTTFPSIVVSGSYSASETPVKLSVGGIAPTESKVLISVPAGKGTLRAEDFELVDLAGKAAVLAGATPLRVTVDPDTGTQQLCYGSGYVYKTANDGDSSHAHVNKDWSDGLQQHAGALYYNAGKNLYLNDPRGTRTFEDGETRRALLWRGDGFVIDGDPLILTYAYPDDAITVNGTGMVLFDSPHFRTWWEHSAIDGKLVVKTDGVCIESTYTGNMTWDIPATLIGDGSARIRFQHQAGLDTNPNYCNWIYTCNVYGNVDDWTGTFFAATNHVLNARVGFPNGTAELARGATLRCTTKADPSFGGLVSSGTVELKAGDVWSVGSLSLDDGVIRVTGDTETTGSAKIVVADAAVLTGGKVRVILAKSPKKVPAFVLEVPAACALAASDFTVESEDGFPAERMTVTVSTDGSGRKTFGVERIPTGLMMVLR